MSIVVYGTLPAWGTPDFSPFVIKLETWLRLAGVPYERARGNPMQAPKGKVPYVDVDGQRMGDSQLILESITRSCGVTLDEGLSPEERGVARAVRRMLEEGTYFISLRLRWLEEDGWALQYPAFKALFPAFVAPIAIPMIRRQVRGSALAQGAGRHTREEVLAMGVADLQAVEGILGERTFLLGDRPRSVDATVYAFLSAIQAHPGTTPVHDAARSPRLLAYTARIRERYWSEAPRLAADPPPAPGA